VADRDERRQLKGEMAADKARAKASRSWYQRKRFLLPLALVGLIVVIAVASGGGDSAPPAARGEPGSDAPPADDPTQAEGGAPTERAPAAVAGIGAPAVDGQFTFTVNSLECGATSVGTDVLTEEAQGQFCLLSLRVENTGDMAQSLFADSQVLLDGAGTEYSSSFQATLANDPEGDALFNEINPGNAVEGTIVFDVPADAAIERAEWHDSAFSDGVEVSLT